MKMKRLLITMLFAVMLISLPVVASASGVTGPVSTTPIITPSPITPTPLPPIIINPNLKLALPVNVAFSAVPNRYQDVDPATSFDVNGDLVGDLSFSSTTVTGKNNTQVQLLDPPALNLDQVNSVPSSGYSPTAPVQLSRVYIAKLPNGGYCKFMLLQVTPKVTLWFNYGTPTTSLLNADGQNSRVTLTWGPLSDAQLGYNVYRYEFMDNNAYSVTLLNDFTVKETTYTDNTASNKYYLYVVIAIKSNGAFGASTTVAPVQVQSVQRNLIITPDSTTAKLDGSSIALTAKPVIKNGRLMVPASALTHAGVKATYDSTSEKITLSRRLDTVTYTIVMTINTPDYTWNGSSYKADVPPYMVGSEVMIPLRVAAPSLAFGLSFNSSTRQATIQWFE